MKLTMYLLFDDADTVVKHGLHKTLYTIFVEDILPGNDAVELYCREMLHKSLFFTKPFNIRLCMTYTDDTSSSPLYSAEYNMKIRIPDEITNTQNTQVLIEQTEQKMLTRECLTCNGLGICEYVIKCSGREVACQRIICPTCSGKKRIPKHLTIEVADAFDD
jgi:hypothetical protein